jgi:hypothetical protein
MRIDKEPKTLFLGMLINITQVFDNNFYVCIFLYLRPY